MEGGKEEEKEEVEGESSILVCLQLQLARTESVCHVGDRDPSVCAITCWPLGCGQQKAGIGSQAGS